MRTAAEDAGGAILWRRAMRRGSFRATQPVCGVTVHADLDVRPTPQMAMALTGRPRLPPTAADRLHQLRYYPKRNHTNRIRSHWNSDIHRPCRRRGHGAHGAASPTGTDRGRRDRDARAATRRGNGHRRLGSNGAGASGEQAVGHSRRGVRQARRHQRRHPHPSGCRRPLAPHPRSRRWRGAACPPPPQAPTTRAARGLARRCFLPSPRHRLPPLTPPAPCRPDGWPPPPRLAAVPHRRRPRRGGATAAPPTVGDRAARPAGRPSPRGVPLAAATAPRAGGGAAAATPAPRPRRAAAAAAGCGAHPQRRPPRRGWWPSTATPLPAAVSAPPPAAAAATGGARGAPAGLAAASGRTVCGGRPPPARRVTRRGRH